MPDPVKSVVGSFSGTSDVDGIMAWLCGEREKKSRYLARISATVIDLVFIKMLQDWFLLHKEEQIHRT